MSNNKLNNNKLNPIEEAYINALSGIKETKYTQPIREIRYLVSEWEQTEIVRNTIKREKFRKKIVGWFRCHNDFPSNKYPKDILQSLKKFEVMNDQKYIVYKQKINDVKKSKPKNVSLNNTKKPKPRNSKPKNASTRKG